MTDPRPYYAPAGLNVETYDARTLGFAGEIDFWVERARASGGPVLELGCGTGRVTWAIARAGVPAVGLELLPAMLERAEARRAREGDAAGRLARFVAGDMTDYALDERFALVIAPFRSFQMLLTPEAQRRALARARAHLAPGGRLILDLFDPRLDMLVPGATSALRTQEPVRHPVSGNIVEVEVLSRDNDPVRQVFVERWRFVERDDRGAVVRDEIEVLSLRWTFRQELRWLLELEGFDVEEERSDFRGAPPAYGREMLVTARAR